MIVGFDGYYIGDQASAWGASELNLIRELAAMDCEDTFVVFVTRAGRLLLPNLPNLRSIEVADSGFRNAISRTRSISFAISSSGTQLDVYLETCEILPNLNPSVRVMSLEHDFSQGQMEYPLSLSRLRGLLYRYLHIRSIRRADILFCNSGFTLKQLREFLRPDQVAVVFPHGCDEAFRDSRHVEVLHDRIPVVDKSWKYFLYVGRIRVRHKRFDLLLNAYRRFHARFPGIKLVVVSSQEFSFAQRQLIREIKDDVILTQGLGAADIAQLYRNALALVIPSEYEGFGIPIIEAQYSHCPVLASDIEVFHEVGDGGCLFFDGSPDGLLKALESAMRRPNLEPYVAKGLANCERFSWQATAKLVMDHLESQRLQLYHR